MQVNVERMPHGLFRKFSADRRLLGAFGAVLVLAVSVACMSLVPNSDWAAAATLLATYATALVLAIFYYAYQRALKLINPEYQLHLVVDEARRDLRRWTRRADRFAPLFDGTALNPTEGEGQETVRKDLPRAAFFQMNPSWTSVARRGVEYSVFLGRRYAAHGDHEVARLALHAVVAINEAYIQTKGRTFFAAVPFVDNTFVGDPFISETLELLRQNTATALARRDEQQVEHVLDAMNSLCTVFLSIDYAAERTSKTHAMLAAGYLSAAVESVIPHGMPDVLMHGLRLMGSVGMMTLRQGASEDVVQIIDKTAWVTIPRERTQDFLPVAQTGMEQFAKLTLGLIQSTGPDFAVHFVAVSIRKSVQLVARRLLEVGGNDSFIIASLAPYYSRTGDTSLVPGLTRLVNGYAERNADDPAAQNFVRHFARWSSDLDQSEKPLFLAAISARSGFVGEMVNWISHVTKLLLAASNSPTCDGASKKELRRNAEWLMAIFSFVPDKGEEVKFVEMFQVTETLFDVAYDAYGRECAEVADKVRGLLLEWAFKAGKYSTGCAILERACCALAVLDLTRRKDGSVLAGEIADRIAKSDALEDAERVRAAAGIRDCAAKLGQGRPKLSRIDLGLSAVEGHRLRVLLNEIANRVAPPAAREMGGGMGGGDMN